jgi:hypothetical protein
MNITEIQSTLQTYFDVMYECDMKKFDQVFHPSCSLFTAGDAELVVKPFEQYRQEMSTRTPPKSRSQPRDRERIIKIDFLSDEMALTQVRVQIHDKLFSDNLNLVKVGPRWMVVAKIYYLLGLVS